MKYFLNFVKFLLLIFAFILTVIIKILIYIGFIRLQFGMNEELDIDLGYFATQNSRWLNQFWDSVLGRYPNQPHHKPLDLFGSAFVGSFTLLKLLFLSLFSWRK